MSEMIYRTEIELFNSYFDMNDRLTAKSILNIFQDVASRHAEDIGLGFETMVKKNLYWVISRIKFDILKQPEVNQKVIVETWPHEKGRIDFDRDMCISSEDGEVLIIATSKWCVIDAMTRSLQRTDGVEYVGEIHSRKNYEGKFGKILVPDKEKVEIYTHRVKFADLDHNKHMNNTNYASIILNAIENKNFSHFEINFVSESRLEEEIKVCRIEENGEEYIIGENNENISFIGFVK